MDVIRLIPSSKIKLYKVQSFEKMLQSLLSKIATMVISILHINNASQIMHIQLVRDATITTSLTPKQEIGTPPSHSRSR